MTNPNLYEDNKGKITKEDVRNKFYSDIGDEKYYIIDCANDIESIMSAGGLTIYYPSTEDYSENYFRLAFYSTGETSEGIITYSFYAYDGREFNTYVFYINGNDLIEM